ncbi:MAG TPA: 2-amino-4-hydroxy-6-hydroxymethyldihydropteridine diphosphokinase [Gemmatimonadaceae bacterium]|jgi:2-amino-4-hydroxy-6-hydroxymethyldihydropteridine diphosphokinase|nr:2-amino-4-hydroxy-6-hydroxymethyldihydropteridine diphosphokinase [Gemmatimonadaceae bacterium]
MIDVAYVALGSNIGDRQGHLAAGRAALAELPGTRVVGVSSVEETQPLGGLDQPWYLNQMVALETSLTPHELLRKLQSIESRQGRVRRERWASRTLDLDIVCYQHQSVHEPDLQVPHPGLGDRSFWQRELAELRGGGAKR